MDFFKEIDKANAEHLARIQPTPTDGDSAKRTAAARHIIAEFMFDSQLEWDDIIDSAWAGELAANLYATWAPVNVLEPLFEPDEATATLPPLLREAMAAQHTGAYAEKCRILGEQVVRLAMGYILGCHGMLDAEIAREDAAEMDAEYQAMIAGKA